MEARETNARWWPVLTLVLVVGLVALFSALVPPYGIGYGMAGLGWGWGVLMMLVPVLLLLPILLAAVGARAPGAAMRPSTRGTYVPTALLDARYARGEIFREAYPRTRADLERGPP